MLVERLFFCFVIISSVNGTSIGIEGHCCLVCRYNGRGIVMSAGGYSYFACAYVSIRVLRDIHKSKLPIELFYSSRDDAISLLAIDFLQSSFENVKVLDVSQLLDVPLDLNLGGYPIKIFAIMLSSFQHVLWLDADNIAVQDPEHLFDLEQYQLTGTVFWPDFCNMHSSSIEMWDVMSLPRPSTWPAVNNDHYVWTEVCDPTEPIEIEAGQMMFDKQRAWNGLTLVTFLLRHFFFLSVLLQGDKQAFMFGFNATRTPYHLVSFPVTGVGLIDRSFKVCHMRAVLKSNIIMQGMVTKGVVVVIVNVSFTGGRLYHN